MVERTDCLSHDFAGMESTKRPIIYQISGNSKHKGLEVFHVDLPNVHVVLPGYRPTTKTCVPFQLQALMLSLRDHTFKTRPKEIIKISS